MSGVEFTPISQYEEQCRQAATDQGLDPVMERLRAEDIPFSLEQTGGFTMVVTVTTDHGTIGIIDDGGYLIGWYPGDEWTKGDGDGMEFGYRTESLDELVAKIHDWHRNPPSRERTYEVLIREAATVHDLPQLLRDIAQLVEDGFTSGYHPSWQLEPAGEGQTS